MPKALAPLDRIRIRLESVGRIYKFGKWFPVGALRIRGFNQDVARFIHNAPDDIEHMFRVIDAAEPSREWFYVDAKEPPISEDFEPNKPQERFLLWSPVEYEWVDAGALRTLGGKACWVCDGAMNGKRVQPNDIWRYYPSPPRGL